VVVRVHGVFAYGTRHAGPVAHEELTDGAS